MFEDEDECLGITTEWKWVEKWFEMVVNDVNAVVALKGGRWPDWDATALYLNSPQPLDRTRTDKIDRYSTIKIVKV